MAWGFTAWLLCGLVFPAQILISEDRNLFLPVTIECMEMVPARAQGHIWFAAEIQKIKGEIVNMIERDGLTMR